MDHLLIAHTLPPAEAGAGPRVQTLGEHSRHVAKLCADACRPFGLENTSRLMGWLHDSGKAAPDVQDHLRRQTREKQNHSAAGMRWIWKQAARQTDSVRMAGQMIALAIGCHHSGRCDCLAPDGSMEVLRFYWWQHNCKSGQYASAKVHRLRLAGNCDVVEFRAVPDGVALQGYVGLWQPLPVEYKRGAPKASDADHLQLCAQAMALEELRAWRWT